MKFQKTFLVVLALISLSACNETPPRVPPSNGGPTKPGQPIPSKQKPQRLNAAEVRTLIENMDPSLIQKLKDRWSSSPQFFSNLCESSEFFNINLSPEGALEAYEILKAK